MGKGGGDGGDPRYRLPQPAAAGRAQRYCVSSARRSEKSGGNATTDAVDGLQFPPDSSASQSQNPAGSSVGLDAGQDTEGLGGLNEGSEKAFFVQLHAALHEELDRVKRTCIAVVRRYVRSRDYNLRQKLREYIPPNGEKAGKSSSKGNLAEGSDAPHAKRKKLWVSKNFAGVQRRNDSFRAEIRLPGMKNKFWLGTFKTAEAAAQAFQAGADWRGARRDSKSFNKEELDDLKKRAKKAGEPLSDDRSHHNVASSDLVGNLEEKATTSASSEGKAVASEENVSQRDSPAHENFSSEERVSQCEFPPHDISFHELNLDNHSPELNMNNCFQF